MFSDPDPNFFCVVETEAPKAGAVVEWALGEASTVEPS
jgi:hypothetical protein